MPPQSTALQHICELNTPNELINKAFLYAKDNIARTMRWYSLGWGMSNAPHNYTIVVGRDTGWMSIGAGYVAPWFPQAALEAFRVRQKTNGQILEYIDLESGKTDDYGLNVSDNTPLYIWAVCHAWEQFQDRNFRDVYLPSVKAAAENLIAEVGPRGLICSVPAGVETRGISSWRNIIPGAIIAGEVTEINAEAVFALRLAARFCEDNRYANAADEIESAINRHLWNEENYLLTHFKGQDNPQITGDSIFPILFTAAPAERAHKVLTRLQQADFWTRRGLRTIPNSDPNYHPNRGYGLVGGSWPNLTLWYAAAIAPHNPDRALAALEAVAQPVVAADAQFNTHETEFAEWFDGDTGVNLGMNLSPWVAPTFIWAVVEGLLGLRWDSGKATFSPHWPSGWETVTINNLPSADGPTHITLRK